MAEKPVKGSNYPLEFWMSRGYPMGPYLRGLYMSAYIREHIKPKELQTMVRNWVQSWLKYLYRYHTTAWNDEATLEELFQPPVVEVHWKARDVNSQEFRTFGLLWKTYDFFIGKWWNWSPPCLTEFRDPPPETCWIFGGISGRDYLVKPEEITQQRAGKWVIKVPLANEICLIAKVPVSSIFGSARLATKSLTFK
ncbi:hypothetical protein NE237_000069 [Protea cynaroides]|uniref:Uncharacterized protein n=1 Tax=Protea cynaroides TaxID=273540 RepID=A0A9Q0GNN0_9MAGN|nr:hypothetical protein NE237_000069 [Protea cynaroides]